VPGQIDQGDLSPIRCDKMSTSSVYSHDLIAGSAEVRVVRVPLRFFAAGGVKNFWRNAGIVWRVRCGSLC
jgi:hypothetical protein